MTVPRRINKNRALITSKVFQITTYTNEQGDGVVDYYKVTKLFGFIPIYGNRTRLQTRTKSKNINTDDGEGTSGKKPTVQTYGSTVGFRSNGH